jgi:leader peptidase (prepilin peptidase)/N-methyltransferase
MDLGLYTTVYWIVFVFIYGALFGSFLNSCIYRLARGESIATPRSHCPLCGTPIFWYDNVPILSYILLRGRCRQCRKPISLQYPLVEAGTALMALAVWFKNGLSTAFLTDFIFLFILLGIAVIDARNYIIPDLFSLGGAALGLVFSLLPEGLSPGQSVAGLLLGGGVLFLVAFLGERIFNKEAMGGGDIKMMAMIGAFLGWKGVAFTLFTGSLTGSLVFGFINYALGKKKLVPFGVFLALGGALYVFLGEKLIRGYLELFIFK